MTTLRRGWVLVLLVIALSVPVVAQDGGGTYERNMRWLSDVYAGPGDSYAQIGLLRAGAPVQIIERNFAGNWLRISGPNAENDNNPVEGWVLTGRIDTEGVRLTTVPMNFAADADPGAVAEGLAALYSVPVVPRAISGRMHEVYAAGQARGNNPQVVTKVGDSNSANPRYLSAISRRDYHFGPYNYLYDSADFFADSLATGSIAARVGLNAFSLFDSAWAPGDRCESDESPLACEYRRTMPAIAVVMFGPNDIRSMNSDQYREQITRIVQETVDRGIIPVLSTFSASPDAPAWEQSVRFNGILLEIAAAQGVPVVNLWSAARILPNYGIGADGVHLTESGARVNFADGHEARFGVSLQNLLVLRTIDVIYHEVMGTPAPAPAPAANEGDGEAEGEPPGGVEGEG